MALAMQLKKNVEKLLMPKGKIAFLDGVPVGGKVLDVGCGNNSPFVAKLMRPDIYYSGIDICDYNQTTGPKYYADEYLLTTADLFTQEIEQRENSYDAVICAHNLEHCNNPEALLIAMLKALRKGGRIYLSFPAAASVTFPSRAGCLNFHDDSTHRNLLNFDEIAMTMIANRCRIEFSTQRYRPAVLFCIGFLLEPFGKILKSNMPFGSTWAYYGFESIIWASRIDR